MASGVDPQNHPSPIQDHHFGFSSHVEEEWGWLAGQFQASLTVKAKHIPCPQISYVEVSNPSTYRVCPIWRQRLSQANLLNEGLKLRDTNQDECPYK